MRTLLILTSLAVLPACTSFGEMQVKEAVELSVDASQARAFLADTGRGDMRIEGDDGTTVRLRAELLGPEMATVETDSVVDDWQLDLGTIDGAVTLRAHLDQAPPTWSQRLIVRVPASLLVELEDGTGDVDIQDIAGLSIIDGTGDMDLRRIEGHVEIIDDTGDIDLSDVCGDVSVEDETGDLRVTDVCGSVRIEDGTGDIDVLRVQGDVSIVDGTGDIYVDEVGGTVRIEDGTGDIRVGQAGELIIVSDGTGEVFRDGESAAR